MLSMDKAEAPALASLEIGDGNIVVIGAYKGDTVRFLTMHHPEAHIYAFEPQEWAYDELIKSTVTKFSMNVALGDRDAMVPLYEYETDACSVVPSSKSRKNGEGLMQDSYKILVSTLGLEEVALLVVNIEGYEYDLLPYLLGMPIKFKNIVIQWHEPFGSTLLETRDLLVSLGYKGQALGADWDCWSMTNE